MKNLFGDALWALSSILDASWLYVTLSARAGLCVTDSDINMCIYTRINSLNWSTAHRQSDSPFKDTAAGLFYVFYATIRKSDVTLTSKQNKCACLWRDVGRHKQWLCWFTAVKYVCFPKQIHTTDFSFFFFWRSAAKLRQINLLMHPGINSPLMAEYSDK